MATDFKKLLGYGDEKKSTKGITGLDLLKESSKNLQQNEKKYLSIELQARIWRNLFGKENYYQIKNSNDKYIEKAIMVLNN